MLAVLPSPMQRPVSVHQPHHAHTVPSVAEQTSTRKLVLLCFAAVLLSFMSSQFGCCLSTGVYFGHSGAGCVGVCRWG